jgi:hypothetical protein
MLPQDLSSVTRESKIESKNYTEYYTFLINIQQNKIYPISMMKWMWKSFIRMLPKYNTKTHIKLHTA